MKKIYFLFIQALHIFFIQLDNLRLRTRSGFTRANIARLGGSIGAGFQRKKSSSLFFVRGSKLEAKRNLRLDENVSIFVANQAALTIGENVFIGKGSVVASNQSILIGDDTQIAHYVTVIDSDHRIGEGKVSSSGISAAPIEIGKNVWIGAHAVILKGVTIGDNSVIGAGAIVTKSVPEKSIALGNPALAKPIHP